VCEVLWINHRVGQGRLDGKRWWEGGRTWNDAKARIEAVAARREKGRMLSQCFPNYTARSPSRTRQRAMFFRLSTMRSN
jgi:hypothetical protein